MGLFDRWRRRRAGLSPPDEAFEALAAEMTKEGVLIITREDGTYTVYWSRRHDRQPSVEGRGATVFEGLLACRAQAAERSP